MDALIAKTTAPPIAPALDMQALDALLNIGGAELRAALAAQLVADFSRLSAAVEADSGHAVARAAHEIKGLAATIGADKLADMARSLDAIAEGLAADARAAIVVPLQGEIAAVLEALNKAAQGPAMV